MTQSLIPKTVSLSAKKAEWGDGSSDSAELGITFAVPDGYHDLKSLVKQIYREQYYLDLHVINILMLKSGITAHVAKIMKDNLANKYKKFLGTDVEDGDEETST